MVPAGWDRWVIGRRRWRTDQPAARPVRRSHDAACVACVEETGDGSGQGGGAAERASRVRRDRPAGRRVLGGRRRRPGGAVHDDRWPRRSRVRGVAPDRGPRRAAAATRQTSRSASRSAPRWLESALVLAEPVIGTAIALGSLIPVVLALPYVRPIVAHHADGGQRRGRAPSRWRRRRSCRGARAFEAPLALRPPGLDAGHRLRAVPALPVERQHPADRHDLRAAPRHRDVARPGGHARSQGRRPSPGAPHRPGRPCRRLRPQHLGRGGRPRRHVRQPPDRAWRRPPARLRPRPLPGDAPRSWQTHEPYLVDVDDPDADAAEVAYLRSHRRSDRW